MKKEIIVKLVSSFTVFFLFAVSIFAQTGKNSTLEEEKEFFYYSCRAVTGQDPRACDNISHDGLARECESNYWVFLLPQIRDDFQKNNDGLSPRGMEICRRALGSNPSTSLCNKVAQAMVNGDASSLEPYRRKLEGLFGLALISGNRNYCDEIGDLSRFECYDNADYTSAIWTGRQSVCSNLEAKKSFLCYIYFKLEKGESIDCEYYREHGYSPMDKRVLE